MTEEVTYVFLRIAADVRHSQIDFKAIENLAGGPGSITIERDARDNSVYSFALPQEIDGAGATRIISALAIQPHIDEAWKDRPGAVVTPQSPSKR